MTQELRTSPLPLCKPHFSSDTPNAHFCKKDFVRKRRDLFPRSLSLSYDNTDPLCVMRGEGCYLIDERGTKYLDTRNNVAHVGHSHPTVVAEVTQQLQNINTNTRYLHPNMVLLAEKLLRTLGAPFTKVFFVNSGSEANDLALRLCRAKNPNKPTTLVLDRAYHGHTLATLGISPYKWKHGQPQDSTARAVPCPDLYRQPSIRHCIDSVTSAIDDSVGALFIESGMSVAGVILPPAGYLAAIFDAVHAVNGLCVCDEVQCGFGRCGDTFWAFQRDGNAVPDIVTVGKPFGNGAFPLAAVCTTDDVCSAFDAAGIEYFNTFAGGPAACAAGLAVFRVLEEEGLQLHASAVGSYLKERLLSIAPIQDFRIGDIRGCGLFLGVEWVRDGADNPPASKETSVLVSRLKDEFHILTSIDGPSDNVLVIKPPMCFGHKEADILVDAIKKVLQTWDSNEATISKHTPT